MIDVLEIRNPDFEIIGIIDTALSVIWHSAYFGVGDIEIYAQATDRHMNLLQPGNYVTRPADDQIALIEAIEDRFAPADGYTVASTGRLAKSVLDRRVVYSLSGTANSPYILKNKVETAVRALVRDNAISCPFDSRRNIAELQLGTLKGYNQRIVDENGDPAQKQVAHDNLLTYSDQVLKEYGLGSHVLFDRDARKLNYEVYSGADRSVGNDQGNEPVVFSIEYENLTSEDYTYDETGFKNTALVGGVGEGIDRFYSLLTNGASGLALREQFVDARNLNRQIKAGELSEAYPDGSFVGLDFIDGGVIIASLVLDLEKEYSLTTLQSKFPTGTVSGTSFIVDGVTYAIAVYGKENTYTLTAVGYKAVLDVDETEGTYLYTEAQYAALLRQQGALALRDAIIKEKFTAGLNVSFGQWILNRDFFLGDIVTVQDNRLGIFTSVRITETTEVQDANGYNVDVAFGE